MRHALRKTSPKNRAVFLPSALPQRHPATPSLPVRTSRQAAGDVAAVGPLLLLATRGGGGGDALLSTLAPESEPVGGRLRDFVGSWSEIMSNAWVLATVEHGYRLEFTSTPPSDTLVRETPVPANREKHLALEKEISSLLEKQAVRPVADAEQFQGFLSTFFLTPKKGTMEWRPIINLKPLNRFIRRFRMETLKVILESLPKAVWAASIDLRDAYLHIPISSGHSRYLRFRYRGRTLEFTALPFGLSTSPRAFKESHEQSQPIYVVGIS